MLGAEFGMDTEQFMEGDMSLEFQEHLGVKPRLVQA
jgi:hypothetical protein